MLSLDKGKGDEGEFNFCKPVRNNSQASSRPRGGVWGADPRRTKNGEKWFLFVWRRAKTLNFADQPHSTQSQKHNTNSQSCLAKARRGARLEKTPRLGSTKGGPLAFRALAPPVAPNRRPHPPRAHRDRAERPRERSPDETRGRKPATRESRRLERSRENSRRREKHPSDAARTPNRRNETTRNEIPPTQVKAAAARARRARARPSRRRPRRASSSRARASRATCAA